ncbi:MAG: hypothetical protein Q8P59_09260, partial [Dehalococcoidia bacterium]|nr:hypothetical protein [Dehalococcoidia bacterium]
WAIKRKSLVLFLVLLAYLVGVSGYSLVNNYWDESFAKDDYRGLVKLIENKAGPDDGLVVMNGMVFDYYYKGSQPRILLPQQYPLNEGEVINDLNRFSRGKSQLWLLQWKSNVLDPDNFILNTLEQYGKKTDGGSIRGLEYAAFKFDSETPFQVAIGHPLEANFDNKIKLNGYTLNPEKVASGQPLEVTLHMNAIQGLNQDYKVSLALLDAQGSPWAQEDKVPTGYSMSRWRVAEPVQSRFRLSVPLGTPPGDYSLAMVVYPTNSQEPLPVVDSTQASRGVPLRLGNIRIERGQLPYSAASVVRSHTTNSDLASEIRLLGYDMSPAEVDQGGTLTLVLYWQALSR